MCIFSSLMFLFYVYRLLDLNLTIWIYVPTTMSLMILKVCIQHYFPDSVRTLDLPWLYRVTWGTFSEARSDISPQEIIHKIHREIGNTQIRELDVRHPIPGGTRTFRWLILETLMPAGLDILPWCGSDSIPSWLLTKWGGLGRKGSATMCWTNS